jgi:hypothetical protein
METPRWITPQGATIFLTPELYQAVIHIVALDQPKPELSREEKLAALREMRGKYRSEPSLTQALLEERAAELAREDARMPRWMDKS